MPFFLSYRAKYCLLSTFSDVVNSSSVPHNTLFGGTLNRLIIFYPLSFLVAVPYLPRKVAIYLYNFQQKSTPLGVRFISFSIYSKIILTVHGSTISLSLITSPDTASFPLQLRNTVWLVALANTVNTPASLMRR